MIINLTTGIDITIYKNNSEHKIRNYLLHIKYSTLLIF